MALRDSCNTIRRLRTRIPKYRKGWFLRVVAKPPAYAYGAVFLHVGLRQSSLRRFWFNLKISKSCRPRRNLLLGISAHALDVSCRQPGRHHSSPSVFSSDASGSSSFGLLLVLLSVNFGFWFQDLWFFRFSKAVVLQLQ